MYGGHYSCQILMKLKFYQKVLEQISDIEFHEIPSCGSGVLCGPTETRDEAVGRFSQFCKGPSNFCDVCVVNRSC